MNTLEFSSHVTLMPFGAHDCDVKAHYVDGDPDHGIDHDWDVYVYVNGVDVTYDISKADLLRLTREAFEHAKQLDDEASIDAWEYERSYDDEI